MKAFVIHRHSARGVAKRHIRKLGAELGIQLSPVLLPKSSGEGWKERALEEIKSFELVLLFDPDACKGSKNVLWEIEQANSLNKKIVELSLDNADRVVRKEITDSYDFRDEFDECFKPDAGQSDREMELYKIMVETSEQLVLRRQRTNAFFITILGSLVAVIGLLFKEGIANRENILVLLLITLPGLVLCNSWRNQIDNYGKLNAGKFRVILRMEKTFPAQIFSAEWVSLGKGVRPKKYRSFTETEKHVPLLFGAVFLFLSIWIVVVHFQTGFSCFWSVCSLNWRLHLDTFGCCP